ncbi:MAG: tetrahydrofolate dehydrogenase/cyclohydrolase catalytic domain-containing protein, partial [Actinomycetota bacterium]|nr:tetrahydrofolate dehydrogenase/cyclohydrolase catalytic domain-containing protein [Actinomycetota bacterium]
MAARIISGTEISALRLDRLTERVAKLKAAGVTPGLAVVIVGEDPASQVYVRNKEKACAKVGIFSEKIELPASATQDELLAVVAKLNARADIDGMLVQFPLPEHLNEDEVIEAISVDKDVDGFHPESIGRLVVGKETF